MTTTKIKPRRPRRQPGKWLGEVQMHCPGSIQKPVIQQGKPHCPVCGEKFNWHDLVNQVQHVPEH